MTLINLRILTQDEIDRIVEVEDFIMKFPSMSVHDIKKKFHLSSEEYDMIFELCMPRIRSGSASMYWRTKYHTLIAKLRRVLGPAESCALKNDILYTIRECEVSDNNELAKGDWSDGDNNQE